MGTEVKPRWATALSWATCTERHEAGRAEQADAREKGREGRCAGPPSRPKPGRGKEWAGGKEGWGFGPK